ncbi:MAG: tRNA 4-thiouridine(8) synthase ThiI [Candidatus Omnitrophota bacterium]
MDAIIEGHGKANKMKKKAIALISGGLDSLLAAKTIMQQGIEVLGVVFVMQFASRNVQRFMERVRESTGDAGIPVRFIDISKEFLEVLKSPRHGYGAHLNPCIDCKILMLRRAKKIMQEEGASFVITGEVLGERPMSQRKDALETIKKESSLGDKLLRPLSARLLEATLPEKEGMVKREELFAISGRSREGQFALAKKYNLHKFFAPAGGCLLADPIFSEKLRDLMSRDNLVMEDITLLKYGRHFRLDEATKAVVGRDENDNNDLLACKGEQDVVLRLKEKAGPDVLLRGNTNPANIEKAAALGLSHSKSRDEDKEAVEFWTDENDKKTLVTSPLAQEKVEKLRI